MRITEVIVNASRTIPHPTENYANLRPGVALKADLDERDDVADVTRQLQRQAEGLVHDHSELLCESIREAERVEQETAEISRLESTLQAGQQRLAELRNRMEQRRIPLESEAR